MTTRRKLRAGCDTSTWSPGLAFVDRSPSSIGERGPPISRARLRTRQLHDLLVLRQQEVLFRARAKAMARVARRTPKHSIDASIEQFADQLLEALGASSFRVDRLGEVATRLGSSWLRNGFDVSELVLAYGDVCQSILELASECTTPVDAADFLILSDCLKEARAGALVGYEEQLSQELSRRDARQVRQLGSELAKLIDTALLALDGLQKAKAERHGHAEALLDRTLYRVQQRIDQALWRVREQTANRAD